MLNFMKIQFLKKLLSIEFPKIPRLITELTDKKWFFYAKITCFSLITTILLVAIILRGYEIFQDIVTLQIVAIKHADTAREEKYWEDVSSRHPGYRDAEFKLAVLSFRLGDSSKAKKYLSEVLTIDPNFQKGREFAKRIGL